MNLIFLNYGLLNSNSGGHVAHFANALAGQGHKVCVIGAGPPESVRDFGEPQFDVVPMEDCMGDDLPAELLAFAAQENALLHAWTPRRNVVALTETLIAQTGIRHVVHLEDNEEVLLAENIGCRLGDVRAMDADTLAARVPQHLTHPHEARAFMERARGVSVIVERLTEHCPPGIPTHVLEPGVDETVFAPDLDAGDRARLRRALYIEDEAFVLFYHGNMHAANKDEVFSLYTAVLILRRRGYDVRLIRAGRDFVADMDPSFDYLNGDWVINLGFLDRARLIEVAKLADAYVQPGAPGLFNDYRLPSKLPEFLALGRPVLLPKTNIGLKMQDGVDGILLTRGDGVDIADHLQKLLEAPEKAKTLGEAGRRFAMNTLNWQRNAAKLSAFYQSL